MSALQSVSTNAVQNGSPFASPKPCYASTVPDAAILGITESPRHSAFVRVTHWLTAICFLALLVSGIEIMISHPRFYWGETGNSGTTPLFKIPIPSSRGTVPSGYNYVLPDQNGWSRYLHFEAAWGAVLTGLAYVLWGLGTRHFRKNLLPAPQDRKLSAIRGVLAKHLRLKRPVAAEAFSYNALQRIAYLAVIFVLFPLVIWTGMAMSPGFNSAYPAAVNLLGGRQSARTLHFLISVALLLFFLVHIGMVILAGFGNRMRAMITGIATAPALAAVTKERP